MKQNHKEISDYEDLYDLSTIRECLRCIEFRQALLEKMDDDPAVKDQPEKEKHKALNYFLNMALIQRKAERYRNREATIQEWVERDRAKQDKEDNTPAPQNVPCPDCGSLMHAIHRHLEDYTDEPLRVLFFFDCPDCKKRKAVYEDGTEKTWEPKLCGKCGESLTSSSEERDEVLTITTACSSCGHTETEVDDFGEWRRKREEREQEEKELLKRYRAEFCLSGKDAEEQVLLVDAMRFAKDVFEYERQKYDDPEREVVQQLKRLNAANLEKHLAPTLEEAGYEKLMLDRPEIGQHVVVPFTVLEARPDRRNRESEFDLAKAIKPLLEGTNWRLMDGISCRLGYVSGRLKGYEQEEDLLKLTRKMPEEKPKELDPEKLSRLGHHNVVQLARISGKMEGIENRRKRRLETEPEGFYLGFEEGPYSCHICDATEPGNRIWWNLNGMRCADCHRNIVEGVIPENIPYKYNQDVWFADWQFSGDFGIHTATARKLRRQGLLVGRDLKRKDGAVYYTVYLASENQEFLEKYPKKEREAVRIKDSEGNDIIL